jgi:II/X family phage/plasmid replication protein
VPVTRHFSLIHETPAHKTGSLVEAIAVLKSGNSARFEQTQSFCDWVSIHQAHEGVELPKINDGAFVRYDAHGAHESTTLKKFKVEGSHETGVFIRCDGSTVWFEGNVSRFGRPDNVFGFTFEECLTRINSLLWTLGLPPFTAGESFRAQCFGGDRESFTGARITRLDLTQNFQSGSKENAYAFMRHLAMQQASRLKTGTYGEGETVDFGRGSRRVYSKAYLKAPEILRHMKKEKGLKTDYSRPFDPYLNELSDWCASVGLVRFETTYKSTFLIDNCQNYLGGLHMGRLEQDFIERQSVFTRTTCEADQLSELTKNTLSVYRMWQAGDDLVSKYSKAQFYRHRSALLPFGVDIAIKSNVLNFTPRVKVIQLGPCAVPSFYELPSPSYLRLAA